MDLLQIILIDWDSHDFLLGHGLKDWEGVAPDAVVVKVTALIISTFVLAYLFFGKSHNKDNKSAHKAPWILSSWFTPFLPMIQMGINHRKFFKECQQNYGRAYRFRFGPDLTTTTFIYDNSFAALTGRYPQIYDMYHPLEEISRKIFIRQGDKSRVQLKLGSVLHKKIISLFRDQQYLAVLCTRLGNEVTSFLSNDAFFESTNNSEWKTANLFNMMKRIVFVAATRAVFGDYDERIESDELFDKWVLFDDMVHLLAVAGQFENLFPATRKGQDEVCHYIGGLPEKDQTGLFKILASELPGISPMDSLFIHHWASNANSGPGLFWVMNRLLRDNQEREEVLAELHTVLGEEQGWSPSSPDAPEINYSVVSKLHHLKSYITDVLRLYSSAWLLRGVMKDQTVTLETGERIILSKGENIVCVNPHVNEEVFAEPHLAKTTRFLPNTRIKDAQGRDVKLPTMMFGHGIYRCPGEQFAYLELVTTVAFMWTCYDFELANPWIKDEPQPNLSRVGFGVMPLDHKFLNHESVQVRFRSRY